MYSTYSPRAPHTYDFVVLTSLTNPRKIYFDCAENRKSQRLISTPTYLLLLKLKIYLVVAVKTVR
jgi:hypothetical protein